ncbi:SGNH/GDSL hydrolase family protein [Lysobacter korlensis]|uniref:SGNH/GDSL hydrolase family protein n=1 Tax=Lysobacter korlensis TaxID=553636 RepID=A0ABV6S1H2_9GAMM
MKVSAVARRSTAAACRYVALGEGFTEGVGDPDRRLPNGVRGWADRVAEGLAATAPGWEYANLALRGRRLTALIAEQLPSALEFEPTLVTVSVGPTDVLLSSTKLAAVLDRYEFVASVLGETGATVVLFTSAADPSDDRTVLFNAAVRRIAHDRGAVLVDPWDRDELRAERLWSPDGTSPSRAGHAELARHLLGVLGVAPTDEPPDAAAAHRRPLAGTGATWMRQVRGWLAPAIAVPPGAAAGGQLQPRWPIPVEVPPRGGLRSLAMAGESPPAAPLAGGLGFGDRPVNL